MSEFLQRTEREIQNRQLLSRGQKILVAVSGGADSMVLLHTLHGLAAKNRWQISVAHFNHQLRGRASDADEKLVRLTVRKLRLKFFSGGGDVKAFAAQSKLSVEMAARKLRHEFLARIAREQKISTVALAHHADDQVELFFLRLLRGAGGEGLAGMKWRSPSPADKTVSLIRPLLGCTKTELLAFAGESKIRFRDDTSNFSTDFLRNKIRNELLPLLTKNYQPGLSKTVLRVMEIVGAESELVGELAQHWLQSVGRADLRVGLHARQRVPTSLAFAGLSPAVQRRALHSRLTEAGVPADFELIEQLRATPVKFISVGSGVAVARDESGAIQLRRTVVDEFNLAELKLKLPGGVGRAEFGGRKLRWHILRRVNLLTAGMKLTGKMPVPLQEFFDADKVGGEIILRHWRAGDRFQLIGLKSAVKLQDLFVNAKIPSARRRELVLATTLDGEIFWVEGLRIGERFKLTSGTRRRLVWSWAR